MFSLADANIHNIAIDGVFDGARTSSRRCLPTARSRRYRIGGQLDQLGARRGPGRLLLQRLFCRDEGARRARRLRRADRQFWQHPRRTRRAPDGPADPPADPRDQRKRRARRVLPHRTLPAAPGGRDACDLQSVDGHLKGVNFERYVFDIVSRDPAVMQKLWARIARGGFELTGAPHWDRVAASFRFRGQHARRSHRDDPPDALPASDRRRSAHRRRHQGRARAARPAGAARVHRDGAAGQVQRDDQGSARARAHAPRGVRGPRKPAAALHGPARGGRRREGVYRRQYEGGS